MSSSERTTVETWIPGGGDILPWCALVAELAGYPFDDLDRDAIATGTAPADRHKDLWFEYSFEGKDTVRVRISHDVWKDNVSVVWDAPMHLAGSITLATSVLQRYELRPR